jgi:hypothetical protein
MTPKSKRLSAHCGILGEPKGSKLQFDIRIQTPALPRLTINYKTRCRVTRSFQFHESCNIPVSALYNTVVPLRHVIHKRTICYTEDQPILRK